MSYYELYKRKSIRIKEYNKTKFDDVVKNLSNLINSINNETCYKKKITLFNNIYDIVIDNFDIIIQQPNNTHVRFLFCIFEKTVNIKSFLETEIEKGERIQELYKQNIKYFFTFETKYMDYIFQNLKQNSKDVDLDSDSDCPICLEKIMNKQKDIVVTNCKHCFHKRCLFNHLLNIENCPICRNRIYVDKIDR